MAKQTTIKVVDDLDGTEGAELVRFGFEGHDYEIDLSQVNKQALAEALARFISAARKAGARGGVRGRTHLPGVAKVPGKRSEYDREKAAEIRAWAQRNGYDISDRGRISAVVMMAWENRTPAKMVSEADKGSGTWGAPLPVLDPFQVAAAEDAPPLASVDGQIEAKREADALLRKPRPSRAGKGTTTKKAEQGQ